MGKATNIIFHHMWPYHARLMIVNKLIEAKGRIYASES